MVRHELTNAVITPLVLRSRSERRMPVIKFIEYWQWRLHGSTETLRRYLYSATVTNGSQTRRDVIGQRVWDDVTSVQSDVTTVAASNGGDVIGALTVNNWWAGASRSRLWWRHHISTTATAAAAELHSHRQTQCTFVSCSFSAVRSTLLCLWCAALGLAAGSCSRSTLADLFRNEGESKATGIESQSHILHFFTLL